MNSSELTYKKIFKFWSPLAGTWLMMSVEGPFIAALIARMADPKFNLAAYGVAFSFALIVEAPVIMMMSASTAIVKNKQTFLKLRNFTYTLNAAITLLMLILIIPDVFYFIAVDLINLPQNVAWLTHLATMILLPWPGAIGYRRFYQGILISHDQTKRVAYGTVIRLSSMAITALIFFLFYDVHGVVVGASALSAGVTSEAIASKLMTLNVLKKIKGEKDDDQKEKTNYKEIFQFYYPLALTSLITLGVQPIVTFFMGQSNHAIESLAVLPVLNSLVFIFRSLGLSFQEVGIALMKDNDRYKMLRNFATAIGIGVLTILMFIALTPLSVFWLHDVSGLTMDLVEFAYLPLIIFSVLPSLTVLINFQRAMLVFSKNTKPITYATITEVIGITIILIITIKFMNMVGLLAAVIAFVIGRLGANTYLFPPFFKSLKKVTD